MTLVTETLEVRVLLGEGCFLRRSRTPDSLWVTDAPLRFDGHRLKACQCALDQSGFAVHPLSSGLWGIDPGQTRWLVRLSVWETVPSLSFTLAGLDTAAYSLAVILRAHPAPLTSQPLEWIRMLYQAETDPTQFHHACERLIFKAAEKLRSHEALPSAAAGLIYQHLQQVKE